MIKKDTARVRQVDNNVSRGLSKNNTMILYNINKIDLRIIPYCSNSFELVHTCSDLICTYAYRLRVPNIMYYNYKISVYD